MQYKLPASTCQLPAYGLTQERGGYATGDEFDARRSKPSGSELLADSYTPDPIAVALAEAEGRTPQLRAAGSWKLKGYFGATRVIATPASTAAAPAIFFAPIGSCSAKNAVSIATIGATFV